MFLNIPIKVILDCNSDYELKLLSDFIFIKTLFSNSCIYRATNSNLSRKTGFSRTKVSRIIKFGKAKGWLRAHADNLVFAWDKTKYKNFISIHFTTQPDIINQLNLFLLKNKKKQCEYAIKLRKDLKYLPKDLTVKRYKKALDYKKFSKTKGEICSDFILSAKGASNIFNCSASTANRILLNLERQGLIIIQRTKCFFKKCSRELFKYFVPPKGSIGSFWWFKGRIYNSLPNTITVPSSQANKLISNKNSI